MKRIGSAVFVALVSGGCVVGAPPGFSDGDRWTVPLVAPLESDVYLVPVKINDKGPYLFMIDPDSQVSGLDDFIAKDLELYTQQFPEQINEVDHKIPVFVSEVQKLAVGELSVRNLKLRVHRFGTFWVGGRRVRGVLGRDVIADSLVFAADRDTGWATIATQGHLVPPAEAMAIKYRNFFGRKLAAVNLNGQHKATLHMDLGSPHSQLWDKKIAQWGLPRTGDKRRMTDELGTIWETSFGANVETVQVANQNIGNIFVVPYNDKRREEEELDGSLGQNFFSKFNVTANWHQRKIWLSPRNPDESATAHSRIRRWGSLFDGCKNDACVAVSVIGDEPVRQAPGEAPSVPANDNAPQQPADNEDSSAGPPAPAELQPRVPASYQLHIEREPSVLEFSYEVLLDAVGQDGKSLGLPRLWVTLPEGARVVLQPDIDPNYAAAAGFAVLDLSPFARDCQKSDLGVSCVWAVPVR